MFDKSKNHSINSLYKIEAQKDFFFNLIFVY